jgi:chemotaxis protein MotA
MPSREAPKPLKRKLDISTLCGLGLAVAGILGGLKLEGGRFSDISQLTAAMIVLGGTAGAVMITTPFSTLRAALAALPSVFFERPGQADVVIQDILRLAAKARKMGLVSLESDALAADDPFLNKALMLAVDGADLQDVRRILELDLSLIERHGETEAKVFEAAGGFAPTIGIIGAVMGLIQVMKHLEDMEAVGHGIAVAFVATVYGVALANLVLLPAAHKLKANLQRTLELKELMLEGTLAIAEGLNPKLISIKLEGYRNGPATTPARPAKVVHTESSPRPANVA